MLVVMTHMWLILMGVAEFLARNKKHMKGKVMLIFQPAEEGPPEGENGGGQNDVRGRNI